MKDGNEATSKVIAAFESVGIEYMLAGSYSSNYYGIPRATRDADFVVILSSPITDVDSALSDDFILDPQASFEGITGTLRDIFEVPELSFKIEVFQLSDDRHDRARFERKHLVFDELLGRQVYIPTAEDVILTKLRWALRGARNKDSDDVRNVIAVQGDEALDWDYIHKWTAVHETRQLLDEIRKSIPPLD